jgi:putative ABC transport system permease protein
MQGTRAAERRRRHVFGQPIIAVQVALAIVLVFGAVIAGRAFVSVLRVPLGFTHENVMAINFGPNADKNRTLRAIYISAVQTLVRRGDVLSAGAGGSVPPDGFRAAEVVDISDNQRPAGIVYVLPGYFETLGIALVRGRLPAWEDVRSGTDVAVVAESAARALFPDRDALGGTFRSRQGRHFTVVGVVADVQGSLSRTMDPPAYVIPTDDMTRGLTLVARMRSRQPGTLAEIRREIGALAPDSPVTGVWWSDSIDALTAYRNPRFQTLVLGTFAALALGLTALGIFAIVGFLVAARTREMGVRLALGASPRSLVRSMMRQALTPVAAGILIGVMATHWLRRIAETQLFQIDAHEPLTLAAAAMTVAAAALVAAYLPARHASRVDPIVVLRAE